MNYSDEQIKDIQERETNALAMLKEMQLTPAVSMNVVNQGNDVFGIKPIPYLQDLKYTSTPSPEEFQKPKA